MTFSVSNYKESIKNIKNLQKNKIKKSNTSEYTDLFTSMKACFKFPNTAGAEILPKERTRSEITLRRVQEQDSAILVGEIRMSGWMITRPHASVTLIFPVIGKFANKLGGRAAVPVPFPLAVGPEAGAFFLLFVAPSSGPMLIT
jgi:hypothetical protein